MKATIQREPSRQYRRVENLDNIKPVQARPSSAKDQEITEWLRATPEKKFFSEGNTPISELTFNSMRPIQTDENASISSRVDANSFCSDKTASVVYAMKASKSSKFETDSLSSDTTASVVNARRLTV